MLEHGYEKVLDSSKLMWFRSEWKWSPGTTSLDLKKKKLDQICISYPLSRSLTRRPVQIRNQNLDLPHKRRNREFYLAAAHRTSRVCFADPGQWRVEGRCRRFAYSCRWGRAAGGERKG
jgi:hypothetical protein